MNYLTDAFFWVSTGLLVPVMVFLLLGFAYALCMLGGYGLLIASVAVDRGLGWG